MMSSPALLLTEDHEEHSTNWHLKNSTTCEVRYPELLSLSISFFLATAVVFDAPLVCWLIATIALLASSKPAAVYAVEYNDIRAVSFRVPNNVGLMC